VGTIKAKTRTHEKNRNRSLAAKGTSAVVYKPNFLRRRNIGLKIRRKESIVHPLPGEVDGSRWCE
jgi:predicted Ser/Thr protein kinase